MSGESIFKIFAEIDQKKNATDKKEYQVPHIPEFQIGAGGVSGRSIDKQEKQTGKKDKI